MKATKFIGLAVLITLLTCCQGDGTLLDLYPLEPIVNPEVRALIQDNRIIHAHLNGRNRIIGVTEKGGFSTDDRFTVLDFQPRAWPGGEGVVGFDAKLIVHASADGRSLALRYSADNGRSWTTFGKPIVDHADAILGNIYPVKVLVGTDDVVWLLCEQHIGPDRRTMLYQIDLVAGTNDLILAKMHALPLAVDFVDGQNGWLLWGDPQAPQAIVHVLKTTDGGHVWSDGAVLKNISRPSIEAITDDSLLIYGQAESVFHSTDAGASFEPTFTGMGTMHACHAVSADVVYMLAVDGRVGKSTDGGMTWLPLAGQARGVDVTGIALHFYDERQGIVYDQDKLFITDDGGASWEVLIYPYDYVIKP